MSVAITFLGTDFYSMGAPGTLNPINFDSKPLGISTPDRISVALVAIDARPTASAVSINGVAATKALTNNNGGAFHAEIWFASTPTGTTGDWIITTSNASGSVALGMYAITGAVPAPSDTDGGGGTGLNNISISGLTIPTNGCAILVGANGDQTVGVTWTNATADFDLNVTAFRFSGATRMAAGTPTITLDGNDGSSHIISGAAWAESAVAPSAFPHDYYARQFQS